MNISSWPSFTEEDIATTSKILKSGKVNYWTGSECKSFEKEFSALFNSNYSIALANGSVALSAAYKALSLNKGDEIITTPRTISYISAILEGLKPVLLILIGILDV